MTTLPFLRPGRWVYLSWYQPLGWWRRSQREGGPLEQWRTYQARRAMQTAAAMLKPKPVRAPANGEAAIVLLTGQRYWEQTAFCLRSFQNATPSRLWSARLIDDGTLPSDATRALQQAFPGIEIVSEDRIGPLLDRFLPVDRFPTLRRHRLSYKHLRKLTDVHLIRSGPMLALDSDQLFFAPPTELMSWLVAPHSPLVLTDAADSYGYSNPILSELAGTPVRARINAGVTGLAPEHIDWDLLEKWATTLLRHHGSNYYLEQALVALMLAGKPIIQLEPLRYRVQPAPDEIASPQAVLHHYVAESKRGYFRHAWRRFQEIA